MYELVGIEGKKNGAKLLRTRRARFVPTSPPRSESAPHRRTQHAPGWHDRIRASGA